MQTTPGERSKSSRDNFGKFIYQFQTKTKTYQKTWKDLNKII